MTKRATKNYVAIGRVAIRVSTVVAALVVVAACSSNDYGSTMASAPVSAPVEASTAKGAARSAPTFAATGPATGVQGGGVSAYGAPVTGADGYPNINVDTARRLPGSARSTADQGKLEAELLALGARQRGGGEGPSVSVIQELQELGRRSKADAERQIESGEMPKAP